MPIDVDAKDHKVGRTALFHAVHQNFLPLDDRLKVIECLLKHGANPNAASLSEASILDLPCRLGEERILRLLLQHGANVDIYDKDGISPLERATRCNHAHIIRAILGTGMQTVTMCEKALRAAEQGRRRGIMFLFQREIVYLKKNNLVDNWRKSVEVQNSSELPQSQA